EVSDGSLTDTEHIAITVVASGSDGDFGGGGGGGAGGSDSTLTGNNPPELDAIADMTAREGDELTFAVSGSDPDGDALTFAAANLPPGASFDATTTTFSWTPGAGQAGSYTVSFEASDGELSAVLQVSIAVSNAVGIAPRISEVVAVDVTTATAEICWSTDEPSTSQVRYWASPSTLTPIDEKLVTHHVVEIAGLKPGVEYSYTTISRDADGLVAESEVFIFSTPEADATFSVSGFSIQPAEVEVGGDALVDVLVTNLGEVPGSYVVVLTVDGVREVTQNVVGLAAGAAQRVAFVVSRDTVGTYEVDVNGLAGLVVVTERGIHEPTITRFEISPTYSEDTGTLTSATALYEVTGESTGTVEVVLSISLDGVQLPDVPLASSVLTGAQPVTGSMDYIPQNGWSAGTYTFRAELRTEDGFLIMKSPERTVSLTPEGAANVVSWWTLGMIIGSMLLATLLIVLFVLHRRRDMLRDWAEDA
ncbi:MAG: putative Ig domain-containing protein, partial [Planctomycetota bacterium]